MASSRVLLRAALIWLLQCAASGCWVASVLVYGSFEKGDRLQLAAALAWSLGNVCAFPDILSPGEPKELAPGSLIPRAALIWLLQSAASGCWVASVLVYGSFEKGDRVQFAAALAWSLSNLCAIPDMFVPESPAAEVARPKQDAP
jgi:hypothetical protein